MGNAGEESITSMVYKNAYYNYLGSDLTALSDEALVELSIKGKGISMVPYQALIHRYEAVIFQSCQKALGNREDAEEVAQDAIIQLYRKLHQFEGRSSFKTWLYSIVRNYCRNNIAKQIRSRERKHEIERHSELLPDIYDHGKGGEELAEIVNEALNRLHSHEKEILLMKFYSGFTLDEISASLGVGMSAAKMRFYRALSAFRFAYEAVLQKDSLVSQARDGFKR